jgi:hypothetical protein
MDSLKKGGVVIFSSSDGEKKSAFKIAIYINCLNFYKKEPIFNGKW